MYRTFYSLTRKPFEISPDPYFCYPTTRHNEALVALNYGVQGRKGLVGDDPSRTLSRGFTKEAGDRTL
jgi:type II secretory pathway predicted ATPase ExeA